MVQSLWIGEQLGSLEQLSIRSFLAQGIRYHLYTYGPIADVPAGTDLCDAAAILPPREIFSYQQGFGRGSFSAFSNLFRYQLLHDRGGWWVDTDVVCVRPFDLDADYVFATEVSDQTVATAASCVVKSPAGAEYLRYCLDVCEGLDRDRLEWGQIGPRLMEDALWRFKLDEYRVPAHFFNPVNYFDFSDLNAPAFDFTRLIGSYGVHLWHQMWVSHNIDSSDGLPPDSLVGYLESRYPGPNPATQAGVAHSAPDPAQGAPDHSSAN
jgi:hypothetical protein